MKATWTMEGGLQQHGQHSGQPSVWTVTAWAELADKSRERIMIRPRGKCQLAGIVEIMNAELAKFEEEHGQPAIAAGFTAIAR